MSKEFFDEVTHEVSTAGMKYALLSMSCKTQISFDIAKVTDFEDASAPFILYNSTRLSSVLGKFEALIADGKVNALPDLSSVHWDMLDDQKEWELLIEFVWSYPSLIQEAAAPVLPQPPALPEFGCHRICEFLNHFVRGLSSYYAKVRLLPRKDQESIPKEQEQALHARMYLCQAFRQVIDNGLDLLMMKPLGKM